MLISRLVPWLGLLLNKDSCAQRRNGGGTTDLALHIAILKFNSEKPVHLQC